MHGINLFQIVLAPNEPERQNELFVRQGVFRFEEHGNHEDCHQGAYQKKNGVLHPNVNGIFPLRDDPPYREPDPRRREEQGEHEEELNR